MKDMLYTAVRLAVLKEWDPIGVGNMLAAQEEYNAYVPKLYELTSLKKSRQEIFEYLWWLETEHMGLSGDRQATEKFAERLVQIGSSMTEGRVENT